MRLPLLLFGLVATAAAAAAAPVGQQAEAAARHHADDQQRVLVEDRFLDDATRAALLCRAARQRPLVPAPAHGARKLVPVPAWFSAAIAAALPGGAAVGVGRGAAEALLPVYEMEGDHPEHQDHHVGGGGLAEGHVGVVYLEGDGDFVLTDAATGAERRVAIEPGKLVAWPNARFRHRVEGASPGVRRRMLGPMVFDAAARGLVGVGFPFVNCTDLAGYECVAPEPVMVEQWNVPDQCAMCCESTYNSTWSGFDTQNTVCYCYPGICTAFVPGPTYSYLGARKTLADCPPLVLEPTDPVTITATGPPSAPQGAPFALGVTLTIPPASSAPVRERALAAAGGAWGNKKWFNSTDYALLVTVSPSGAVTYKRTFVLPRLKPRSLKKPVVQGNGDLLWPRVPVPVYQNKNATRAFKIIFRVGKTAASPVVLGASVWKGGEKLYDAAALTVTVTSRSK